MTTINKLFPLSQDTTEDEKGQVRNNSSHEKHARAYDDDKQHEIESLLDSVDGNIVTPTKKQKVRANNDDTTSWNDTNHIKNEDQQHKNQGKQLVEQTLSEYRLIAV